MKIYLFKPRFARLVKAGTKRQTIRPRRKNPPRVGEELSLREWTGRPYWSPQRVLRDGEICTGVRFITVHFNGILISIAAGGETASVAYRDRFARLDGFHDWPDMRAWFYTEHGLPFEGELVTW